MRTDPETDMDTITFSKEQSRVIIWLEQSYTTQADMLEAAAKALQREVVRLRAKDGYKPWDKSY